ncbi:hypothetical protein CPB86DRAFT_316041 [Serendipita vermifera]|nr:hypothetical protein CPB86DRAFT_316041 [Serendipita vermifera]
MPARRNPVRSKSRSAAKRSTKKTNQQYDCFICISSSKDHLMTVTLDSTTLHAHDNCIRAIPELEVNLASPTTTATTLVIQDPITYRKRSSIKCSVCRGGHGVKIQCIAVRCARAFHVNCASESRGIHFELLEGSEMPYKLLCRMHNSTIRRNQWASIRRKKEDLINIYMANISEGDTITVNLKRERHCLMEVVKVNHSDRTLDVISELVQRAGQRDETAIRTVEWKQIVVKDSYIPAALRLQMYPQAMTSREPSPLPPVSLTSATTSTTFILSPLCSPPSSLIEWEQESREIHSALFPTSTWITNDDDSQLPPSKPSRPTSDSGSDCPPPPVLRTNSDVMMDCDIVSSNPYSGATQQEDEDLREYTPWDPDLPPSYSGSTAPDSSAERVDNNRMYLPPLYVLNPAEIQQACRALFTLPNWNNLINQVMEDCAPSHL